MAGYFLKNDFTPSTSSTYTVSFWIKINNFLPTSINVPYCWSIGQQGQQTSGLFFQGDTTPYCIGFYNGANGTRYMPTNYMRDTNAWYHVHLKVSSGTGTLYYNGESVKTSIVVPAQNSGGVGNTHAVHTYVNDPAGYDNLECVMSHFHFVDGTAYDPTVFGSTDSTTGEWKINTAPSVTYGTNGYFILKDGNTGTDQSPNSNNFTLTGTCTKTEDNPSNVFCTLNPLTNQGSYTFEHGNNSLEGNNTNAWTKGIGGTLAAKSGKYYWEVKQVSGSHTDYNIFGFMKADKVMNTSANLYSSGNMNSFQTDNNTTVTIYGQTGTYSNYMKISGSQIAISDGDVVSFALDLDNRKCWVAKNGVWVDDKDGNTNGSSINTSYPLWGTGEITADTFYTPASIQYYDPKCQYNFGNGYFGTTAVASAGTNASGNGIFEHDVPAGYTALSTKGLNE